jgi:MFS transporter, PPP family, 3-phenylpropionic acid transporter
VRLWGSIGFVVAVIGLGYGVDLWGAVAVPVALLLCYLAIAGAGLLVAEPPPAPQAEAQGSILRVLRHPTVLAFFAVCLLHQAGHAAYYAFYSIYLEEQGYSKALTGQLWALGVVAEVGIFVVMHRLLQGVGARRVLIVSLLLTCLRWLLIGHFPQSLPLLLGAQVLHAASFGTFHAAAIHLVHHYFTGRHQGRGQALYGGLSFGAGGAIGSLASGLLWSGWGATLTFDLAAFASLLAALVAWRWVRQSLA